MAEQFANGVPASTLSGDRPGTERPHPPTPPFVKSDSGAWTPSAADAVGSGSAAMTDGGVHSCEAITEPEAVENCSAAMVDGKAALEVLMAAGRTRSRKTRYTKI